MHERACAATESSSSCLVEVVSIFPPSSGFHTLFRKLYTQNYTFMRAIKAVYELKITGQRTWPGFTTSFLAPHARF